MYDKCISCKSPAYVGAIFLECTNRKCKFYKEGLAEELGISPQDEKEVDARSTHEYVSLWRRLWNRDVDF